MSKLQRAKIETGDGFVNAGPETGIKGTGKDDSNVKANGKEIIHTSSEHKPNNGGIVIATTSED